MNIKSELKQALWPYCDSAASIEAAAKVILEIISKRPPLQQSFNQIEDARGYFLHHPNSEMITRSCLHFLGDEAQEWWANKHSK